MKNFKPECSKFHNNKRTMYTREEHGIHIATPLSLFKDNNIIYTEIYLTTYLK